MLRNPDSPHQPWPDADVVIAPSIPEWEDHPRDYVELRDAIRALDLSTEIGDVKVPHTGSDVSEIIPLGFGILVASKVVDAVLDAVIDRVMEIVVGRTKVRWWTKGKRVKGVIYGPDGKVLREVTWESMEGEREWVERGS
jgi:hypothetical protein